MKVSVFTLWATMPDGMDVHPWMIAAEDEASWEGDPDRCEAVFKEAREKAAEAGWEVREVTLSVDYDKVVATFLPAKVEAEVET